MKHVLAAVLLTTMAFGVNVSLAQEQGKAPTQVKTESKAQTKSKLNINKASLDELIAIPGIGQAKAKAIQEYIKANGPIKSQQQLTDVKGIGDKLAAKVAEHVSF